MKKLAIIVVGEHYAGKSKTINRYLKPKLSIRENQHKFSIGDCNGFILSQTLEERNSFFENLERYKENDILVLPTRPEKEPNSLFQAVKEKLKEFGFDIVVYEIKKNQENSYYQERAKEIYDEIQSNCNNSS